MVYLSNACRTLNNQNPARPILASYSRVFTYTKELMATGISSWLCLAFLLLSLGTAVSAGHLLSELDAHAREEAAASELETREARWLDIQHPADFVNDIKCETSDASPLALDGVTAALKLIGLKDQSCCQNSQSTDYCCTTVSTFGTAVVEFCSECDVNPLCVPCKDAGGYVLDIIDRCANPITGKVGGTNYVDPNQAKTRFDIYHK